MSYIFKSSRNINLLSEIDRISTPSYAWGKGGSAGPGQYFLNENVESNKTGRLLPFDGFLIAFYFVEQKNIGTRSLELQKRSTPGSGAWTTVATVSAPNGTKFGAATFVEGDVPLAATTELSVRVALGSDDFEDVVVGVIIRNA